MIDIESLGLLGVFIAGAIPWMEAIAVVPAGILIGLNPVATLIAAVVGNSITIILFAYFASNIRA
jgi:Ca2+/H+ antiporter, TMEM165/GDT1 family